MSHRRTLYVSATLLFLLAVITVFAGLAGTDAAPLNTDLTSEASLDSGQQSADSAGQDPLILSYAAKFVCRAAIQPGQLSFASVVPIVEEKTEVLIHNPHDFPVTFYKKAVRAPLEDAQPIAPGKWRELKLGADYAVRIDCDDIAVLLTGKSDATFVGAFGIGVKVEGFVVIGIGPQTVAGSNRARYSPLDVTAEYVRSSEVLKKDISYQPWWRWWWWSLPWRLGYPYERIVNIDPTRNIDCRGLLYDALTQEAGQMSDKQEADLTVQALAAGRLIEPGQTQASTAEQSPALVAMVGNCHKIDTNTASVDYVLLSNKGSTDSDPRQENSAGTAQVIYPWIPGHWYDLTVVLPQNVDVDIDDYFRKWQTQRWLTAGGDAATVQSAMVYYFPWWCGWGYWWWWNGNDCIDIGVGEGESLDVEQIAPKRVFMSKWPPGQ